MNVIRFCFSTVFILIVAAAYGQHQDSLRYRSADTARIQQPAVLGQQGPVQQVESRFTADVTERIDPTQLPPQIQTVLISEEYRGWENGIILRNINTQEYRIEIPQGQTTATFYFDRLGERLLLK